MEASNRTRRRLTILSLILVGLVFVLAPSLMALLRTSEENAIAGRSFRRTYGGVLDKARYYWHRAVSPGPTRPVGPTAVAMMEKPPAATPGFSTVAFNSADDIAICEGVGLLCDSIFGAPPFQISLASPPSGEPVVVLPPAGEPAQEFVLQFELPGGLPPSEVAGWIRGIVGGTDTFSRGECIFQGADWAAPGANNALGLTILVRPGDLEILSPQTYTPTIYRFDGPKGGAEHLGQPPVRDALSDKKVVEAAVNAWALRRCRVVESKAPEGDTPGTVEAVWDAPAPWLYHARLSRAVYEVVKQDGTPVLRSAKIYGKASDEPVALVRWEDPRPVAPDRVAYGRVVMDIQPAALAYSDRGMVVAVAPLRRIIWRYDASGSSVYPLEAFIETFDGARVVTLQTIPAKGVGADTADVERPLEGPQDDPKWQEP